jgi:hypothetical protein
VALQTDHVLELPDHTLYEAPRPVECALRGEDEPAALLVPPPGALDVGEWHVLRVHADLISAARSYGPLAFEERRSTRVVRDYDDGSSTLLATGGIYTPKGAGSRHRRNGSI